MLTVYKVDSRKVFTGKTIEKTLKDPIKRDEIMTAPPQVEGFHIWDGHKWFTRPEYPHPATYEAPRQTTLALLEFRNRLTLQEKVVIENARDTDPMLRVILGDMEAAQEIDLESPQLIEGLQYIESQGLIAAGRTDEILA